MPRIEEDIKLDFKDVLIRPKRSTLKSRADVDVSRVYCFRNSKREYEGIPIMAANMDTVGTFEMAKALSEFQLFSCIHKHYSVEDWKAFRKSVDQKFFKHIAVSGGTGDLDRLKGIIAAVPELEFICLDVANGYSEHFIHFVEKTRLAFPTHTIIAGNVVTHEMVEELILKGADIVKVRVYLFLTKQFC